MKKFLSIIDPYSKYIYIHIYTHFKKFFLSTSEKKNKFKYYASTSEKNKNIYFKMDYSLYSLLFFFLKGWGLWEMLSFPLILGIKVQDSKNNQYVLEYTENFYYIYCKLFLVIIIIIIKKKL